MGFVDVLTRQRDNLLEQINSLLTYIRLSKNVARKEEEPIDSSRQ